MKLRAGFVSNSSSSSFVLLGAEVEEESERFRLMDEHNLDWPSSNKCVGFVLTRGQDYGLNQGDTDLSVLNEQAEKLRGILGDDATIKLFYGEEY